MEKDKKATPDAHSNDLDTSPPPIVRLFNYLFGLVYRRKDVSKLKVAAVRESWISKKHRSKFIASAAVAILITGGLDLMIPYHSFGSAVERNWVLPSFMFSWVSTNQTWWLPKAFEVAKIPFAYLLSIAIVFHLSQRHLEESDPLSRKVFIRSSHLSNCRGQLSLPFKPFCDELRYYAKVCPSNHLGNLCDKCKNKDKCPNKYEKGSEKAQANWEKMILHFTSTKIDRHLGSIHTIRKSLLVRYVLIVSASWLSVIYIASRLFEWGSDYRDVNWQLGVLLFIALLYLLAFLLNNFVKLKDGQPSNSLTQFELSTESLVEDDKYEDIHKAVVCSFRLSPDNEYIPDEKVSNTDVYAGREFDAMILRAEWIDTMLENKYSFLIGKESEKDLDYLADNLCNLQAAVMELFSSLHSDVSFRVVLYLPDLENERLVPTLPLSDKEDDFVTLRDRSLCDQLFRFDKESTVAVEAWNKEAAISKSGAEINYFDKKQSEYLKSLIALPIRLSNSMFDSFQATGGTMGKLDVRLGQQIGVLCVDCDHDHVFHADNHGTNTDLLLPFIMRFAYELSIALYQDKLPALEGS